jgi:hypothetical protein
VQILDHGAVEASLPLCGWPAACDRRSGRQTETAVVSAPVGPTPAAPHALPLVFVSRPIPDRVAGQAEIAGAEPSFAYRLVHCLPVGPDVRRGHPRARVPVTTSSTLDSATSARSSCWLPAGTWHPSHLRPTASYGGLVSVPGEFRPASSRTRERFVHSQALLALARRASSTCSVPCSATAANSARTARTPVPAMA